MPSHYIKCDGCGAILDRWPPELSRGDGTFGRYNRQAVREYAASIGWAHVKAVMSDDEKDYCPKCSANQQLQQEGE